MFGLIRAVFCALPRLSKDRPMCLLAMGSYSSFAPVSASILLRIPYVLHEANVVPGRLVSLMASRAAAIAISFEKSRYYIQHPTLVETGMPLRAEMVAAQPCKPATPSAVFSILVTGGSRGAQRLNEIIPEGLRQVATGNRMLQVVHVAGLQPLEPIEAVYRSAGIKAEVVSYVHDMALRYVQADLVICRAGASTCAELCAFGKPALLVPYPYAVRDHQMLNARALEDVGAADVIEQEGVTAEWLCSYVERLMGDPDRLLKQAAASKKMGRMNAAEEVVALLEAVGSRDEQ
jgi:UDP-N-acetylglucosamine--N-acetylmuramyl-(pentapeptide) pyrophosphoryl-undecaprenol N-acetylglucosamine transferase